MKNKTKWISVLLISTFLSMVLVGCASSTTPDNQGLEQDEKIDVSHDDALYKAVNSHVEVIEKDGEITFEESDRGSFISNVVDPEERVFTDKETGELYEHVFEVLGTYTYDNGDYDFVEYKMFIAFEEANLKGKSKALVYHSNKDSLTWDDYSTEYYDESISETEKN